MTYGYINQFVLAYYNYQCNLWTYKPHLCLYIALHINQPQIKLSPQSEHCSIRFQTFVSYLTI